MKKDDNSRINSKTGTYHDTNLANTKVEYNKEVRICFVIALIIFSDGNKEGQRCILFDYTEKNIVQQAKWLHINEAEVCCVRRRDGELHRNKRIWAESACNKNMYEQNKIMAY